MTHLNAGSGFDLIEAKNDAQAEILRQQLWNRIAQASVILFRAFARARSEGVRYNGILEREESLKLKDLLNATIQVEIKSHEEALDLPPIASSSSIDDFQEEKSQNSTQQADPKFCHALIKWQNLPNENAWNSFIQALPASRRNQFLICSSNSRLEDAHLAATAAHKAGFKHVFRVRKPLKTQTTSFQSSPPRVNVRQSVSHTLSPVNGLGASTVAVYQPGKREKRRQHALGLLHMC